MRKIVLMLMVSTVVLTSGVSVAYYNTKRIGFDSEATIISRDDEKISFLDFDVYYKDIDNINKEIRRFLPEKTIICNDNLCHYVYPKTSDHNIL